MRPASDRPGCLISVVCGQVSDNAPLSGIEVVVAAERLGFRDAWIGEAATYDVFALATGVATRTREMRYTLGPLPVAVRDPVTIARGAASVAVLTGQQVNVALGTSSDLVVEQWHGRSRARSARALAETAQALAPLLRGERSQFDGELIHTSGYRLKLPAPEATITIAGFGDLAIRAAARHADRLVVNLVTPELAGELAGQLAAAAGQAGRDCPRIAAWVPCAVEPAAEALVLMRRALVGYIGAPGYREMFRAAGFAGLVGLALDGAGPKEVFAAMSVDLLHAVGLVGSAADVAAGVQRYLDAGVDEICVLPALAGDPAGERTLRTFAALAAQLPVS